MSKNIYDFSILYPEAKLLISAHNMHIAASKTNFAKWMGSWLNDYFKSNYYRLAIAVGSGSYTAAESLIIEITRLILYKGRTLAQQNIILKKSKRKILFYRWPVQKILEPNG